MEVIKKGRKQNGWTKEYICTGHGNKDGGCGAVLLVSASDIFISGYFGDYTETGDPAFSFKCPDCEVVTDIKSSDLPKEIIQRLTRRK